MNILVLLKFFRVQSLAKSQKPFNEIKSFFCYFNSFLTVILRLPFQIFLEDAIEMVGYAIEEGSQYAKKLSKRDREDKGQVTDFF